MRYRLLSFLLLFALSACSFQVETVTPPPPATNPPAASTAVISPSDIPPLTTPVLTPVASSTPLQENAGVYAIQFAPGGTYVDVMDSIPVGSSRTYSINAMKGQVMSISIRLGAFSGWTVIPMKIVGADGTTLCPSKEFLSCYFWRGVLPATQDYFVTLAPEVDVTDFAIRVAIDPPGTTSQSFPYLSSDQALSFSYTDEFAPVLFPELYISKFTPELALQFIDSKSLDDTNLIEAYFLFGSSNDPGLVKSCTQPVSLGGEETVTGEVNVNGVSFTRSESAGLGAGNIYEETYYRTVKDGYCYEVTFLMHSANIGNYAPDSGIREFDRDLLTRKMEGILSTLVIK